MYMPDVFTHILCGHDIVQGLEQSWRTIILEKEKLFNLGCQGPDMFFYNDFISFAKTKRGLKFGRMMHREKTGDFLIESINYLKEKMTNQADFNLLFTYISGLICHFGLDRKAHPYIYYHSGKQEKSKPETRKYGGYHKRLELIIDTILMKERKSLESHRYPVYEEINIGTSIPKSIIDYYVCTLSKTYNPKEIINFINDSYRDMKTVLMLSYDPSGIKKTLMRAVDRIVKDNMEYNTLIYPRKIDNRYDYMNTKHNSWNHPCDKNERYSESFYDIYDLAVKESLDMIKATINYLENKTDINNLRKFFPNISYITGKETDVECELIYYKPIFEM